MGEVVYTIGDNLYINLTNRCSCKCSFCIRFVTPVLAGYDLTLEEEPSVEQILESIPDPSIYTEIVFCGYGEPTMRLQELLEIAGKLKGRGASIRLNTNGHGSLINGRNIVPELINRIDALSVSLNAANARDYVDLCNPQAGEDAFHATVDFILEALKNGLPVTATAVDIPGLDIDKVETLAKSLGAKWRLRMYN
jgi:TatD DNase family protein